MPFATSNNAYQSERRMIQFRARIWKRVNTDPEYRNWMLTSTKNDPVTKQVNSSGASSEGHPAPPDQQFCDRFMRLPGEIRNQIYDELLKRQTVDAEPTPLFRSIYVTKRSHAAASFTGPSLLPVNGFLPLRHIGHHRLIWNELFSRWVESTQFNLTEAFELQSKPPSIKDKLLLRQRAAQDLPFMRYANNDTSRVFERPDSWFSVMRSCHMSMHLFDVGASGFKDDRVLLARLRHCAVELASIMKRATCMDDLSITVHMWPEDYQRSSSMATWKGQKLLPKRPLLWTGLEPLKGIQGIQHVSLFAGPTIAEKWSAENDTTVVLQGKLA